MDLETQARELARSLSHVVCDKVKNACGGEVHVLWRYIDGVQKWLWEEVEDRIFFTVIAFARRVRAEALRESAVIAAKRIQEWDHLESAAQALVGLAHDLKALAAEAER